MRSKLLVVLIALVSVALIGPVQGPADLKSLSIKLTFPSEAPIGPTPIDSYHFDGEVNGALMFSEVRVSRLADESSPRLFLGLVKEEELTEVEITSTPLIYGFLPGASSKVILREARLTRLEGSAGQASTQTEVLGFSFAEIEIVNGSSSACWDVEDGVEC